MCIPTPNRCTAARRAFALADTNPRLPMCKINPRHTQRGHGSTKDVPSTQAGHAAHQRASAACCGLGARGGSHCRTTLILFAVGLLCN